jgi:hypothetical protein
MTTEHSKPAKSLQKRFLIFTLLFGLILTITLVTKTTPFEELTVNELVLKEAPDFAVERDVTSKNSSIEYKIKLRFIGFDKELSITNSDLEFANRAAIKDELEPGDTVVVTYHDTFLFICQLSKNAKNYLDPEKAFKAGNAMDSFVLWVAIIGVLTCLIGFFLTKFSVKNAGWLCTGIILVAILVLFFSLDIHFSNTIEYTEFNAAGN